MFRRPQYIVLFFVVAIVVLVFKLPSAAIARSKFLIGSLLVPFFGVASSAAALEQNAGRITASKGELLRQNQQLTQQNAELRILLERHQETLRENNELREALQWRARTPGNLKLAKVIGRDPANWWRSIQINIGSKEGIYPNLPVRTAEGLIGRVMSVGLSRSQVALLGDPNLRVGALVIETRETGVIIPSPNRQFNQNLVDLGYLAGNSQIKPGYTVVTSGDGGLFPKGIQIGKVVDSRQVDFGIAMESRVQLAADLTSLDLVWVLLP